MARTLNFKQALTAAFGDPIAENPTQAMIEAAYRHHKLDWRYLTIEVKKDANNHLKISGGDASVITEDEFNSFKEKVISIRNSITK